MKLLASGNLTKILRMIHGTNDSLSVIMDVWTALGTGHCLNLYPIQCLSFHHHYHTSVIKAVETKVTDSNGEWVLLRDEDYPDYLRPQFTLM